ncbi:hypothetical protein [Actinomadura geliboluensis]|uniref:hypothetical protein n=1 Tax=Actinomadura geliboluensis TaxID=882440 RepID=UPI003691AA9E
MPTRKTAAKTTAKTTAKTKAADEIAAPDTEAPPAPPARAAEPGYAEQAAQIAADARALATSAQQAVSDLNTRCVALLKSDTGEHPPSTSGVQRLPMAATDVFRALRAYGAVAAELAADAQR